MGVAAKDAYVLLNIHLRRVSYALRSRASSAEWRRLSDSHCRRPALTDLRRLCDNGGEALFSRLRFTIADFPARHVLGALRENGASNTGTSVGGFSTCEAAR